MSTARSVTEAPPPCPPKPCPGIAAWMRHRLILVAVLAVWILPQACLPSPESARDREGKPAVTADRHFNRLFTRSGPGWTGGDGTASVALPDGRSVWFFGDSFLGSVRPDRSRPDETPMIRNCLVVQTGNRLKTLHGGSAASPRAWIRPDCAAQWYWPADGTVDAGKLWLFLWRFESTGTGGWDWRWVGTDLAVLSLPELTLVSTTAIPGRHRVMYGAAVVETPEFLYIYGVEDLRAGRRVHLARTSRGSLLQAWQYFDGGGWTPEAGRSAPIHRGTANQFSVVVLSDRYLLITMDDRHPFGRNIVAYTAATPAGPWQTRPNALLYRVPLPAAGTAAYNAVAHPQFTQHGRWLISYNLNAVADPAAVYRDADLYRPYFLRVDLERALDRAGR